MFYRSIFSGFACSLLFLQPVSAQSIGNDDPLYFAGDAEIHIELNEECEQFAISGEKEKACEYSRTKALILFDAMDDLGGVYSNSEAYGPDNLSWDAYWEDAVSRPLGSGSGQNPDDPSGSVDPSELLYLAELCTFPNDPAFDLAACKILLRGASCLVRSQIALGGITNEDMADANDSASFDFDEKNIYSYFAKVAKRVGVKQETKCYGRSNADGGSDDSANEKKEEAERQLEEKKEELADAKKDVAEKKAETKQAKQEIKEAAQAVKELKQALKGESDPDRIAELEEQLENAQQSQKQAKEDFKAAKKAEKQAKKAANKAKKAAAKAKKKAKRAGKKKKGKK